MKGFFVGRRWLSSRTWTAVFTICACCLVVAGVALATIPDTNGVIQGCYQSVSGNVRLVDSASNCRNSETPISWNAQGGRAFVKTAPSDLSNPLQLGSVFQNIVSL